MKLLVLFGLWYCYVEGNDQKPSEISITMLNFHRQLVCIESDPTLRLKTLLCSIAFSELARNWTSMLKSGWSRSWKTSTLHLLIISKNFCCNLKTKNHFSSTPCLGGYFYLNSLYSHNINQKNIWLKVLIFVLTCETKLFVTA